jgi:hypothetical protein
VRCCLVTVRLNPGNFRPQDGDPLVQFMLRIRRKIFASQFAGGIAPRAR